MLCKNYQSCNLIGHYHFLGTSSRKFDFVHQTISCREAAWAGHETRPGERDYIVCWLNHSCANTCLHYEMIVLSIFNFNLVFSSWSRGKDVIRFSLGPRPKTNSSVDHFQYICAGWGLGTRLAITVISRPFPLNVPSMVSFLAIASFPDSFGGESRERGYFLPSLFPPPSVSPAT